MVCLQIFNNIKLKGLLSSDKLNTIIICLIQYFEADFLWKKSGPENFHPCIKYPLILLLLVPPLLEEHIQQVGTRRN